MQCHLEYVPHFSYIQSFNTTWRKCHRCSKLLMKAFYLQNSYYLQVRYKLAPIIWKRLYKDRLHFTGGGANAITLLLGGRGDSLWPSTSLTLIIVTAFVACVHTIMLSKYLISAPLLVHDNNR